MATYFTLLTTVGEAKLTAAQVTGNPVVLAALGLGDGNGAAYTPTAVQTDLVRELTRVTLEGVEIDPISPTQFRVRAIVPASVGGFTVREIGLYDDDEDLIAVGKFPEFYKPQPSDGFSSDLLLTMVVAYSGTPLVTIVVDDSQVYATREWVLAGRHYFAVKSATTSAPPSSPAAGDHYLIPASGASGAWAGKGGKVAIWRSSLDGWLFATPPDGARATAADTDDSWLKAGGVWTLIAESPASALYLHANCL